MGDFVLEFLLLVGVFDGEWPRFPSLSTLAPALVFQSRVLWFRTLRRARRYAQGHLRPPSICVWHLHKLPPAGFPSFRALLRPRTIELLRLSCRLRSLVPQIRWLCTFRCFLGDVP